MSDQSTMPRQDKYMEIFHSKPSMANCYFLEKLPDGQFTTPSSANMLRDASHIRPGFRVMRRRATRVEFVLTDGSDRNWENNNGANYVLDAVPGRYVVEHGIKRVGEADNVQCAQAVLRSADRFIHISFRADLWERCFASFQTDHSDWTPAPGEQMTLVNRPEEEGRIFELIVEAQRLSVAFNDGADVWDANAGNNYLIGLPGRYTISDSSAATYVSPTDKDLAADPQGTPLPSAQALAPAKPPPPLMESAPGETVVGTFQTTIPLGAQNGSVVAPTTQ